MARREAPAQPSSGSSGTPVTVKQRMQFEWDDLRHRDACGVCMPMVEKTLRSVAQVMA